MRQPSEKCQTRNDAEGVFVQPNNCIKRNADRGIDIEVIQIQIIYN